MGKFPTMFKFTKIIDLLKQTTIFFIVFISLVSCGKGKPNTNVGSAESKVFVYLPTNAPFDTVLSSIKKSDAIIDFTSFEKAARLAELDKKYRPGKYLIKNGMTNSELITLFTKGKREEVKVSFNYARTVNHLAGKLDGKLESDSADFAKFWNDTAKMKQLYKIDAADIPMLFIPNTYNFYWNTDPQTFTDKMYKEYEKFWNDDRKAKAKKQGLTPAEVVTLASIVQSEQTKHKDEWPIIAKLYLNRLHSGMMLQADPTVIFALGDFTITRVLERHLECNSPYNTYKCLGLPPGPIMITEGDCIDAVLNPDTNDYIYMCAKEDFSGKHNFTADYKEHQRNAVKYRKALSKWERENK
jgi:UPF0755 protein